jgi:GNAT superfamily N-acetyltransferase
VVAAHAHRPLVRPIRAGEMARLSRITLDAYAQLGVDVGPYRAELADVAGRAAVADVLVAVSSTTVLGGVTYVADADNPYAEFHDSDAAGVRMLAVDPAAQGRGVGGALVDVCIARAAATGRRRVVLHTTAAMLAAGRVYARRGFRRAPERDWSPREGILLLGYELPLVGRSVEA